MNRHMESLYDGYAKAIRLFPNPAEGMHSDWEKIGQDIDISIKIYSNKLDNDEWQKQKKKKLLKMRYKMMKMRKKRLKKMLKRMK